MKMIDRFKNGEIVVENNQDTRKCLEKHGIGEAISKPIISKSILRIGMTKEFFIDDKPHLDDVFVPAEEFIRKAKEDMEFIKDMLETGMVVDLCNGQRFMVIKGEFKTASYGMQHLMFIDATGFMTGKDYNLKLEHEYDEEFSVNYVYRPNINNLKGTLELCSNDNLIWQRNDQKDKALKELEEAKAELKKAQEKIEAAENKIKGCEQ